ncbi:hypothetical protein KKG65_00290 [Patescibacteria group bacterium]|nr:hypothetical protein [Patescibacteria group bacterium]
MDIGGAEKSIEQGFRLSELRKRISSPEDWMRKRWETNIVDGFSRLDNIKIGNPKIEKLKDYAKNLDEKFEYLNKPVGLTAQQAELLMSKIPKEDRDAGFDATILSLRKETNYLDELEEVGISAALLTGLENGKYKAFVLFLAPDSIFTKGMKKKGVMACYFSILDTVVVPQKAPTSEEMWLMLATEGRLPEFVSSLDHELTHDLQWSKGQRAIMLGLSTSQQVSYFSLLQKYGLLVALSVSSAIGILSRRLARKLDNDEMLAEIHAYEASASSPSAMDNPTDKFQIAGHVIHEYELKSRIIEDALRAYDSIHLLRIMGLKDKKLGELVTRARFDEDTRTFPRLEQALIERKNDWGIINDEDFEKVTKALLAQHDMELRFQRHRAQEVATRELRRETGKWFD